jgi:DNA-3-methyladenine glycosylase II
MILLPQPPLFSFDECIWFLNRNYDDCLHIIKLNEIRKAIEIDGNKILFSIKSNERNLCVEILQGDVNERSNSLLTKYIVEWFDLKKNIVPFYELLGKDRL